MKRLVAGLALWGALHASHGHAAWPMHVIGDQARGADGVRLADVNGDRRPDILTAFEEGGEVRLFLNPGGAALRQRWPSRLVGLVADPEDAVAMQVDGQMVVLSAAERQNQALYIHRQVAGAWATSAIAASRGPVPVLARLCEYPLFARLLRLLRLDGRCWIGKMPQRWMYILPLEGEASAAFVAGSKEHNGSITLFRKAGGGIADWTATHLARIGWTMSLMLFDVDADGVRDILYSDRRGPDLDGNGRLDDGVDPRTDGAPRRGVFALRRAGSQWQRQELAAIDAEVMFLDTGDLDGDGVPDIVAATKGGYVAWLRGLRGGRYELRRIPVPAEGAALKAVAVGDVDGDGQPDLVLTVESSPANGLRVYALILAAAAAGVTRVLDIAGPRGQKFDRIELVDLDGDGDLDVLTTEEGEGLGVIWFENPGYARGAPR